MKTEENRVKLHLDGAHNILFLLIIVAGVILSGVLPTTFPVFSEGLTIMGVTLSYASIIEIAMILAALPGMRFRKLPFFSSVSLLR